MAWLLVLPSVVHRDRYPQWPLAARDSAARRRRERRSPPDDRRDGPGREVAPQRTAPENGQGRGVGREMNFMATILVPPLLPLPLPLPSWELFSLYEEEHRGTRLDRIPTLSGPQERVLRRIVQQIVAPVPSLPTLDDPAPQMVENLPGILLFFEIVLGPGYRSAQDLARGRPSAIHGSRAAAGGTAGLKCRRSCLS